MPREVQGQIYRVSVDYKLISIKIKHKLEFFYLPPRFVKEFRNYLFSGVFVSFTCDPKRFKIKRHLASRIIAFEKIMGNRYHRKIAYFDQKIAKQNIVEKINRFDYRLFLDLEMTLQHSKYETEEIVQIGAILVNRQDEVIWTYNQSIKPTIIENVSKKTLNFLNITAENITNGISYKTFYEAMRAILLHYAPIVVIWGDNDKYALQNSYNINKVTPIFRDQDFLNMQEVFKKYFNFNYELGLFTCAKILEITCGKQHHDAYDDAEITRRIFNKFYAITTGEIEFDFHGKLNQELALEG